MTAQDATKAHKNAKARREKSKTQGSTPREEVKVQRSGGGATVSSKPKGSPVERLRNYFKGVYAESKRVSWPGKNEVRGGTLVTLFILVVFSVYLVGMDFLLNKLTMRLGL